MISILQVNGLWPPFSGYYLRPSITYVDPVLRRGPSEESPALRRAATQPSSVLRRSSSAEESVLRRR